MGDGHAADKPTPPPPPRPVLLAGASGDAKLCRAAALSREEVIRRRRRGLLQLHSLYRAQLWALADGLSARHAEYWWEHGSSPDAGNAVGSGAPPPPHPAVNGGGAAVEIAAARAGCSAANCGAKAMPFAAYCFDHILFDPKQLLYKPCAFVTNRSGMQNGVETCGKPVLTGITPSRCSDHDPKSQRLVIEALKKVGIDLHLTSNGVPKLNLLICETVRQIQRKRKMQLNGAKNAPFHRSSD
uniref:KAT8 regulatory NSL complex subunit 2 n=1 Tax=Oryza nivara TaxID=4536 RepID=A0A0E0J863_ORYNI